MLYAHGSSFRLYGNYGEVRRALSLIGAWYAVRRAGRRGSKCYHRPPSRVHKNFRMITTPEQIATTNDDKPRRDERIARAYRFADLARYTFKQRLAIKIIDSIFYLLISFIGRTTRFDVEGWEHWRTANADGQLPIYASWHSEIFLATYFFRHRRIVVMTSQSFDGEYIARFIQRFGYGVARGSTTRGGTGALIEMMRLVKSGCPAGFTVDGPRGPAHVAQPGAILLAKKTGAPVLPFSVHVKRKYEVPSWDKLQVPYPFSKATVRIAAPIYVPPDADESLIDRKQSELQTALEALSVE